MHAHHRLLKAPPAHARRAPASRNPGFALVVTISLMVLLMILSVGLLSLSALTLRASSHGQARAQAESNARLALLLAIGDLQRALGPDRRISAPASSIHGDKGEPNLVGAWGSWRWDPRGGGRPDYSEKKDRFQRWLVSNSDPRAPADIGFAATALKDAVRLVRRPQGAAGGDSGPELRGGLVAVGSGGRGGTLAFAVMDESQKAPLHLPEEAEPGTADEIAWRVAPPRARPELLVAPLAPSPTLDPQRLVTLPTAVLAATGAEPGAILGRQHELTTCSLGLLTDVVRGGFRTDLTTAFESGVGLADLFGEPTPYFTTNDGAPLWDYLRSHYRLYQKVGAAEAGTPKIQLTTRDLRAAPDGFDPAPASERLMPVIAKLQIVFSIITHFSHISDRVAFFNDKGNPRGNTNYGCPHLVYDPVVTLYNPYDVALELQKLRIRIWDPPVVFGFKKNQAWLRDEFAGGNYHGLARFQIANEKNANARKYFTLLLTDKTRAGRPGGMIRLEPGEVKVFSPWVENNWTWRLETETGTSGYEPRCFFDWNAGNDFGNRDNRTSNTFGVETVPGWDSRAGLQTDHLSYITRPVATRYDFELANNWNGGWLAIKRNDTFSVHAKPGRTVTDRSLPDFVVDLLAGQQQNPQRDYLRSYVFRLKNVESELTADASAPVITRTELVDDLLQTPTDPTPGGKLPFAMLTMAAKTTVDQFDVAMPWLHNQPAVEGADQNTALVGNALDTYDLRFEEMTDFDDISIEPATNRGFFGASASDTRGVSNVPMFRVPLLPAASLGDLIPSNLVAGSRLPRVTHPLGNSRAHPLVPANQVARKSPVTGAGMMLDHSYLLNDALWDATFFSTVARFSGGLAPTGDRSSLLAEFLAGERKLLNPRLVPVLATTGPASAQAAALNGLADDQFARRIGGSLAVAGAFNVNSDSVDAWRALLASLHDHAVRGWRLSAHDSADRTSFPRMSLPLGGDAERAEAPSIDVKGQIRWAGFRALTAEQIEALAQAIVAEIRQRGQQDQAPALSLGEFINRRVADAGELHAVAGLLERALEASKLNEPLHALDSKRLSGSDALNPAAITGLAEPAAREGYTASGAPPILTQGDLLMPLAQVITVRGDTFRIRAYGEARDAANAVTARAWCEAVVQRFPEYLDPVDAAELPEDQLTSKANRDFGRRFLVRSFRWLPPEEI